MPYVIDGNNLLGSWGGPQGQDDRRAEVVRRVAAFCRAKGAQATLVFDGHPLRPDMEAQDLGPLAPARSSAGHGRRHHHPRDRGHAPTRPAELIVVTSDKALYSYVKTAGATVLRAHEWNALERRLVPIDGGRRRPGEKPDREDDVEGWLKKFGGGE